MLYENYQAWEAAGSRSERKQKSSTEDEGIYEGGQYLAFLSTAQSAAASV